MRSLSILFLVVILAACSSAPPVPVDHFYRLTLPEQDEIKSARLTERIIYVGPFLAEGLYNERALLHTGKKETGELQQYHYHFWLTSPPRLLHDHLVRYLRDADTSSMVITEPGSGEELKIFGKLNAFERWVTDGHSLVNVVLELKVNQQDDMTPVFLKEYRIREEVSGDTLTDVITAFDRAVIRLYSDFVADMQTTLQ